TVHLHSQTISHSIESAGNSANTREIIQWTSEERKTRWKNYQYTADLMSPDTAEAAKAHFLSLLAVSPEETFAYAASLPKNHPGLTELSRILINHVMDLDIGDSGRLLTSLSENKHLGKRVPFLVANQAALIPERERELFSLWSKFPENAQIASTTASSISGMLENHGTAPDVIHRYSGKILQLPAGAVRGELMHELLSHSYEEGDITTAQEILMQLPDSGEFDKAIGEFAFRAKDHDPAAAMDWATSIQSEESRWIAITGIAYNWEKENQMAVQSWYDSNVDTLDMNTREYIEELLKVK
ncbi:MAG: hypothetical protein AAF571_15465, partial [Verrucomicrobiota bacterium]